MRQSNASIGSAPFVWALGSLCQVNRLPFEPQLLLQQFPGPHDLAALQRAAKALGLKVAIKRVIAAELHKFTVPFLVLLNDVTPPASEPNADATSANVRSADDLTDQNAPREARLGLGLMVRADKERILYFEAGSQTPTMLSVAEFGNRFAGQIILAKPATKALVDPDAPQAQGKFGLRWFIPELLKHKKIWRDVLLASLVIQLIALATPLFTQVVIDKVAVHHTMNTLLVIGIAFLVDGVATRNVVDDVPLGVTVAVPNPDSADESSVRPAAWRPGSRYSFSLFLFHRDLRWRWSKSRARCSPHRGLVSTVPAGGTVLEERNENPDA